MFLYLGIPTTKYILVVIEIHMICSSTCDIASTKSSLRDPQTEKNNAVTLRLYRDLKHPTSIRCQIKSLISINSHVIHADKLEGIGLVAVSEEGMVEQISRLLLLQQNTTGLPLESTRDVGLPISRSEDDSTCIGRQGTRELGRVSHAIRIGNTTAAESGG